MEIQNKNIWDIRPYWNNPRINKDTVKPLKEAIKKFGFLVPLVIDENNVIISGHTRFQAVTELLGKLKEERHAELNKGVIPCIVAEGLTPLQRKEFRISDNKIAELSKWDKGLLETELKAIGGAIGFSIEELNELVGQGAKMTSYTKSEINKADQELKDAFKKLKNDNIIDVTCPECGKEFGVK